MEEIAVCCYDTVLPGKVERCIDLPLRRDADRAARAHDDLQLLREQAPESGACNGRLVRAADMHEGHIPVHHLVKFLGNLLSRRHRNLKSIYCQMS